ncbi:hypothetical protein OG402_39980 [Streptomyces anulatus]|uniref:hypothetical protein n=1 Tax=Streptomyces anulatus TaxID=1892 RepID=UPI00225174CB|nr:hypothetical protein [Streptomyces anulatus]MCX4523880.1 hypothetical protein [Streptomyces anulatus]MCX4606610.1 hypothetical protein [Streptomyces anulatus]WSU79062.1 hypothetical protein OG499_39555 [Streptomyces anulatus]WTD15247.1 hypothetical protein OHA54_38915 [Streptomyces anulatus]WTD23047.1 hypothetical protein OH737_00120 [Streptomyces anulatus]
MTRRRPPRLRGPAQSANRTSSSAASTCTPEQHKPAALALDLDKEAAYQEAVDRAEQRRQDLDQAARKQADGALLPEGSVLLAQLILRLLSLLRNCMS